MEKRSYKAGEKIFNAATPVRIFLIRKGAVRIMLPLSDSRAIISAHLAGDRFSAKWLSSMRCAFRRCGGIFRCRTLCAFAQDFRHSGRGHKKLALGLMEASPACSRAAALHECGITGTGILVQIYLRINLNYD